MQQAVIAVCCLARCRTTPEGDRTTNSEWLRAKQSLKLMLGRAIATGARTAVCTKKQVAVVVCGLTRCRTTSEGDRTTYSEWLESQAESEANAEPCDRNQSEDSGLHDATCCNSGMLPHAMSYTAGTGSNDMLGDS